MAQISDVLSFQIERRMFSLCKKALEELEKSKNYSLKLEVLMRQAGFEDPEFFKSEENFKSARKLILDESNTNSRELKELMEKFIVVLKK